MGALSRGLWVRKRSQEIHRRRIWIGKGIEEHVLSPQLTRGTRVLRPRWSHCGWRVGLVLWESVLAQCFGREV